MFGFGQIQSSSVGGSPVEPANRYFCSLNYLSTAYDKIIVDVGTPLAMSDVVRMKYLIYMNTGFPTSQNQDLYSDSQNLVYSRWRSGDPQPGIRGRWGGGGPTYTVTGLGQGSWFEFDEQHNLGTAGHCYVTIKNLTLDTTIFDQNVTGYSSAGTLNDFAIGVGTDLSSNPVFGMIANFKVYNAADELTAYWRIDDNDTNIINYASGNDGTLAGTGYEWQLLPNPLAGQPMNSEPIATITL